jgi:hypothetical protein
VELPIEEVLQRTAIDGEELKAGSETQLSPEGMRGHCVHAYHGH